VRSVPEFLRPVRNYPTQAKIGLEWAARLLNWVVTKLQHHMLRWLPNVREEQ